jgi:hypothetical protein
MAALSAHVRAAFRCATRGNARQRDVPRHEVLQQGANHPRVREPDLRHRALDEAVRATQVRGMGLR